MRRGNTHLLGLTPQGRTGVLPPGCTSPSGEVSHCSDYNTREYFLQGVSANEKTSNSKGDFVERVTEDYHKQEDNETKRQHHILL